MRPSKSKTSSKSTSVKEKRTHTFVRNRRRRRTSTSKNTGDVPNAEIQTIVESLIPIKVNGVKYFVKNNHRDNNVAFMNSVSRRKGR